MRESFGGEDKREALLLSPSDILTEHKGKSARLFSELHSGRLKAMDTSYNKGSSSEVFEETFYHQQYQTGEQRPTEDMRSPSTELLEFNSNFWLGSRATSDLVGPAWRSRLDSMAV